MLNNLTNFFNLIAGRRIKTQLEPSDLIAVGTKQSKALGDYKPTAIQFKDLQAQLGGTGGGGDLQQVTDVGNTTNNNINLDNSAIVLDNGSLLQKGFIDNGADGGIARICSIGYQDEWENGVQYFVAQNSNQIVWANSINNTVPDNNFDITMGYVPGSIFHDMNNHNKYICTDNTNGAATWNLHYDPVGPYSNVVFVDVINGDNTTGLINRFDKPFKSISNALTAATALSGINIDNRALVYIRRGTYNSPVINLQNNVDIYCESGVVFTGSTNIRDNGVAVNANIYGSLKIYSTSGSQPPFNISGASVITFEFDWMSVNAAAIQIFPTVAGGRVTIKGNYIYSATIGQGFAITIRNNVNVVMNIANSIEAVHQLFRFRFFSGTAVINCPNLNLSAGNVYGGNWKQIFYIDEASSTGNIIVNGDMNDKDDTFYGGLSGVVRLWTSPAINLTINGNITSLVNAALALGVGSSKVTYVGKIVARRELIYVDDLTSVNIKNSTLIRFTNTVAMPILVLGNGQLFINDSTIHSGYTDGDIINIESNNAKLYVKGVLAEGNGINYFINTGISTPFTGVINTASTKANSPGFVNGYTVAGSFSVDSAIKTPKF